MDFLAYVLCVVCSTPRGSDYTTAPQSSPTNTPSAAAAQQPPRYDNSVIACIVVDYIYPQVRSAMFEEIMPEGTGWGRATLQNKTDNMNIHVCIHVMMT